MWTPDRTTVTAYVNNMFDKRGVLSKNSACVPSTCGPYERNYVVKPQEFSAGQEIGDRIKQGTPVVVSVVDTDPVVGRRIIDFCSACV